VIVAANGWYGCGEIWSRRIIEDGGAMISADWDMVATYPVRLIGAFSGRQTARACERLNTYSRDSVRSVDSSQQTTQQQKLCILPLSPQADFS